MDLPNRLENLKTRIGQVAPFPHPLHDYFCESLLIIQRLRDRIDAYDGSAAAAAQHAMNQRDAGFLATFLDRELEVVARKAEATYHEIDVRSYGLVGDGHIDNGPALRRLLADVRDLNTKDETLCCRIVFPGGCYYVTNEPGIATIELVGLKRTVFEGRGDVTLLCDGRAGTKENLLIDSCEDLEFRNLTIDNRPIPYTLGEIVAIEDGTTIVIQIRDGYPEPDESYWTARYRRGVVKDPTTGYIVRSCGDPRVPGLESLGGAKYRLTLDDSALSGRDDMTSNMCVGQHFALHPRQRPDTGNGISINACRHLLFSHFDVHSADAHAFGIASSAGVKLLDCAIEPAPGRTIMTNADAFHCRSNAKGIYLDRCRVLLMNDDCMNFYSRLSSVGEVIDDRHMALMCTTQDNPVRSNYHVGDTIAFVNTNTGEMDGITVIEEITGIDWRGHQDTLCLATRDNMKDIISRVAVGRPDTYADREYTSSGADNYRAAMAIDAPFEHMVLNLNAKNDGFIVRDCVMGHNRATGFKCKARNGTIRNTRFLDQVLLFQSEPDWQEGTFPGNIEMIDVVADRGIRYQATLPGRTLRGADAARHMTGIRFDNVRDASGDPIPSPDGVVAGAT